MTKLEEGAALKMQQYQTMLAALAAGLGWEYKSESATPVYDEEGIDFVLKGYALHVGWDSTWITTIGRKIEDSELIVSTYKTSMGGRWHPPETWDVEVLRDRVGWLAARDTIKWVFEQELDAVASNVLCHQAWDKEQEEM